MTRTAPVVLHLANVLSRLMPLTRWFGLRRRLFAAAGIDLAATAQLCGRVVFQYPNAVIGDATWVGANTEFVSTPEAGIVIGSRCDVSQHVLFVCGSHRTGGSHRRAGEPASAPIRVGDGTWIGARVTVLGGTSIGSGCVVAAGSVVRGSFGDDVLIAGVPARVVRAVDETAES